MEDSSTLLPRVTIQYCTQCKWMLRAAYLAQELLSTFSLSLGEVALQPSTGGTFIINLYIASSSSLTQSVEGADQGRLSSEKGQVAMEEGEGVRIQQHLIWDRKVEGGFPETKILKRLIRDIIEPDRHLGHVDAHTSSSDPTNPSPNPAINHPPTSESRTASGIPTAIKNRLFSGVGGSGERGEQEGERNFTPMEIDTSQPGSRMVSGAVGGEVGDRTGSQAGSRVVSGASVESGTSVESGLTEEEEDEDGEGGEKVCRDGECD